MIRRLVHIKVTHLEPGKNSEMDQWVMISSVLTNHEDPAAEMTEISLEYKKAHDPEAYITETGRTVTWLVGGERHFVSYEVL